MARRGGLCRHRRALPVPARPGIEPGRDLARHPARRSAGGAGRLARLHDAVGRGDDPLRLWGDKVRRSVGRGLAARAEDRRCRGRGAGGMGDGTEPLPRPAARHDRGRRGDPGARGARGGRPDRRDRRRRADRLGVARQQRRSPTGRAACGASAARLVGRRRDPVLRIADRSAATRGGGAGPAIEAVRFVLPLRRAGVRRRPCRIAALAGRGRAAGLGIERYLPRRLWCGAGGAGTAVHLLGLSRHGHGTEAEWLARRPPLPRRDLPAVIPLADRRVCHSGRACGDGRRCNRRCAASMRRWSGCCSPRSTGRYGRARSSAPPILLWGSRPFCCWRCGRCRPGSS